MRKKKLLFIGLVVSLLVSAVAANIKMVYATTPTVTWDPPTITTAPFRTFTATLKIADATNLFILNVSMFWNAAILNFVSAVEGDFYGADGGTIFSVIGPWDAAPGLKALDVGCAGPAHSGSGTFATLTFECIGIGETSLDIWNSWYNIWYLCNSVNGYVYSNQPIEPVASFTPSSVSAVTDESVAFDASSSLPGWSGAAETPIDSYAWDFESDGIVDSYGETVTHTFAIAGTYGVTLKVTDSQGLWGTEAHTAEIVGLVEFSMYPLVLNQRSPAPWIICIIQSPTGYSSNDIDVSSIVLEDTIPVDPNEPVLYTKSTLTVKFDRSAVVSHVLSTNDMTPLVEHGLMTVQLTLTGSLNNGAVFQGSGIIKIVLLRDGKYGITLC